jgi:hypothetical protein
MEKAAVAEPRRSPDVVSYGPVKDECAQTGETDRAELWFNLMVRAGVCRERGETQSSNRQWFPPAKWELRRKAWPKHRRLIKLGLSINGNDEDLGEDDDPPQLEEVEGAADETSKMEEVH